MPSITHNQLFPSFLEFNIALEDWSIEAKFTFRITSSDTKRIIAKCVTQDCPFHLRAYFHEKKECVIVGTLVTDHNCLGSALVHRRTSSKQSWLQRIIPTIISVTKDTPPKAIIEAIKLRYQEEINYNAAFKAKNALLEDTTAAHLAQFQLLPAYIHALQSTNPGVHIHLSINPVTQRFQRVFIAPPTSREVFKHVRPLVAMDGTFTKGTFSHVLMLAICLDAENHIVILAWAIVESENESSWRYFLSHLKQAIPDIDQPSTTIISDRDKGLAAADNEFSQAGRLYCVQHIGANVKTKFGVAVQAAFKKLTTTLTIDAFQHHLREFQALNQSAAAYVMQIDLTMWAPPYTIAKTYSHRTSNIVEAINSHFASERQLTCIEILNSLWNKTMNSRFERLKEANLFSTTEHLTKFSTQLLRKSLENSQHKGVQMADRENGVVTGFNNKHYIINFTRQTCSCGWFQQHGIPCGHAIACLNVMRSSPRDFVPYNLTTAAYRATYINNYYSVDVSRLAILSSTQSITTVTPCSAPQMKNPRGRPQGRPTVAHKEKGVGLRQKPIPTGSFSERVPQVCSICHQRTRHNKRTCRAPPAV